MFQKSVYRRSENDSSLLICVQMVNGTLERPVTFGITASIDSDPMTVNGMCGLSSVSG